MELTPCPRCGLTMTQTRRGDALCVCCDVQPAWHDSPCPHASSS